MDIQPEIRNSFLRGRGRKVGREGLQIMGRTWRVREKEAEDELNLECSQWDTFGLSRSEKQQ